MAMTERPSWRCVPLTPPTPAAAIGAALRQALPLDGETRLPGPFADLLGKLEPSETPTVFAQQRSTTMS